MRSIFVSVILVLGITPAKAAVVDSFALSSETGATQTSVVLALGTTYTIEVSGTFQIGCIGLGVDCKTDAEYYVPGAGGPPHQGVPYGNSSFNPEGGGGTDIGVQIDGVDIFWGPYNPSRIYSIMYAGLDSSIDMRINDTNYGDNSGSLNVRILDASVSAVPVPAAFWLFGTALLGFVGISRRTQIA